MPSQRMLALVSLVPSNGAVVDIGSDHGQLVRLLWQANFPHELYATELTHASYQTLHHALHDLPIHTYQADGLAALPEAVATIVIAGMGGQLIQKILTKGEAQLKSVQTLVLGPQRDAHIVRIWLMDHGWTLDQEGWVEEAGQSYPLLKAIRGKMQLTAIEAHYGPLLIASRNPQFCQWLNKEASALSKSLAFEENKDKRARLDWILTYVSNR